MYRLLAIAALCSAYLAAQPAPQPAAPAPPAFEVVDLKVNTSGAMAPQKEKFLPGGRIELDGATLKEMIVAIYGVKSNMIEGGPPWIDTVRYDILAKAAPTTPIPTLLEMVKTMLADQFKLKFHREDRVVSAYALTVAKNGPPQKPSTPGGRQTCNNKPGDPKNASPTVRRECTSITFPEFVRQLGLNNFGLDDKPVVDQTHLDGPYDVTFEFALQRRPGADGRPDAPAQAELAGPTIFEAMAKVGLKIETGKYPVPVIIVDHAERPPDN